MLVTTRWSHHPGKRHGVPRSINERMRGTDGTVSADDLRAGRTPPKLTPIFKPTERQHGHELR